MKSYHTQPVLRGVDFHLAWGACLALFGPNGSGKTTLVRTIATLAHHDDGLLRIASHDPAKEASAVRRAIGVLAHQTFLYDYLTGLENLRFYGRMYGVMQLDARIQELAHDLAFEPYLHRRVQTLSHGTQKRLALARALLHKPRVLLLDEPETGLDPEALILLERLLKRHCESGGAVLLTTHNVEEGLALSDEVAILSGGRIAYHEPKGKTSASEFRSLYARVAAVTA